MDFARVLAKVDAFLAARGCRHAVIGGLAMAAYGMPRTTLDLDFVVEAGCQEALVAFLEDAGWRTLHRSAGYSNHDHPDPLLGSVDFVYVGPATAEELFADLRIVPAPAGLEMAVPRPEHLAAMKVLAMKNDPARTFQELADIRHLLRLPGVDRGEVARQFERHGLRERFDDLARTL